MGKTNIKANIPDYIIQAADEYCRQFEDSGNMFAKQITVDDLRNAFYACYKTVKKPKAKLVVLSVEQEKLFEECWAAYGRKGNKGEAKKEWAEIPPTSTPFILPHIKSYVSSREAVYKKDFERYLRDKVYTTNVVTKNGVIYDVSQREVPEEYRPVVDGVFLIWNERRKCLIFNGDINHLNDGYTVDNRPDGATVAWGMYEWRWSKSEKKWIKQ